MNVYIDLNIFDRIEKKEKLETSEKNIYTEIENLILEKKILYLIQMLILTICSEVFKKNQIILKDI